MHSAIRIWCGAGTAAACLMVLTLGCNGDDEAKPPSSSSASLPTGNLLMNSGFESGDRPWTCLGGEPSACFTVSQEQQHTGASAARLRMRDPVTEEGAKVYYLVQELEGGEFPEVVRGFYRAENWMKGTRFQYLQFVIIAFGPENFPADAPNYQMRYPLAGIDSRPFEIGNAHFVFVDTREDPVQGEWVPFELEVKADFERLWGQAPEGFEKLRFLFEVRWDNKLPGVGAPEADVYYDDLYAGSK